MEVWGSHECDHLSGCRWGCLTCHLKLSWPEEGFLKQNLYCRRSRDGCSGVCHGTWLLFGGLPTAEVSLVSGDQPETSQIASTAKKTV